MPPPRHNVTQVLLDGSDQRDTLDQIMPIVYGELRRLAHAYLRQERSGHTMSTTALVHEAYLNLVDQTRADWKNRAHFMATAARAMRRILLQYARSRNAQKRGGGQLKLALDDLALASPEPGDAILALDEALRRLEAMDERLGKVVEYRYFGGLTNEEVAEVLEVSVRTIKRDWRAARAWLHSELAVEAGDG